MKIDFPFFSIIIPTYNRANLIAKTLDSILNQSFKYFEVVIVDDGSTDKTSEIIAPYISTQIRYIKKINAERGASRNVGINEAKGQFVTFIDSDDLMYANHLETAYNFLQNNPHTQFYGQGYETKTANGNLLISHSNISNPTLSLLKGNFLSCIGVFVNLIFIKENKLYFSENRAFSGTEDWALWLQILARTELKYQNIVTASMIEHEERSVLSFSEKQLFDRTIGLKEILSNDSVFVTKFGIKTIGLIYAHMLSYGGLHLALSKNKKAGIKWYISAIKINFKELLSRRFLAFVKILLFQ
ncbi:MAG: hypothetical protein RLZZ175_2586 [Bacteroidota bacterium]|jgi:glycosyltransferase involved in cell wall biosynthesis